MLGRCKVCELDGIQDGLLFEVLGSVWMIRIKTAVYVVEAAVELAILVSRLT